MEGLSHLLYLIVEHTFESLARGAADKARVSSCLPSGQLGGCGWMGAHDGQPKVADSSREMTDGV